MSKRRITVTLPEDLYESVQADAARTGRSVEDLLVTEINAVYVQSVDTKSALNLLETFSDDRLWQFVQRRIPWNRVVRQRELLALSERSEDEQKELRDLIQDNDRYVLLRSKGLLLLKQRGYDVDSYLDEHTIA